MKKIKETLELRLDGLEKLLSKKTLEANETRSITFQEIRKTRN